jgi:hypothetical protein
MIVVALACTHKLTWVVKCFYVLALEMLSLLCWVWYTTAICTASSMPAFGTCNLQLCCDVYALVKAFCGGCMIYLQMYMTLSALSSMSIRQIHLAMGMGFYTRYFFVFMCNAHITWFRHDQGDTTSYFSCTVVTPACMHIF